MRLNKLINAFLLSLIILIFFEVISSAIFPVLGIHNIRLAANILLIFYLSMRLETPFLPILILIIQSIHSTFSIEGWAIGTFIAVLVSSVISYFKGILELQNKIFTFLLILLFQLLWFVIWGALVYLKSSDLNYVLVRFLKPIEIV